MSAVGDALGDLSQLGTISEVSNKHIGGHPVLSLDVVGQLGQP